MASIQAGIANISPLKRTFDQSTLPASKDFRRPTHYHNVVNGPTGQSEPITSSTSSPRKRRSSSFARSHIMLTDPNSTMSASFPSFMSVFGNSDSNIYQDVNLDDQSKIVQHAFPHDLAFTKTNTQTTISSAKRLTHRNSINSFSDSTDSSPTTTNSTFDSPLVADPSPSSSPESASSAGALHTFENVMQISDNDQPSGVGRTKLEPLRPSPTGDSGPQDVKRNLKNLTLDMSLPALTRSTTTPCIDANHTLSAPTSPLKEPLRTGRRKPTNLTIRTPGFQQLTFEKPLGEIPPTPNRRPGLHQYQSSPSLASLASPSAGPAGGMYLRMPNMNQHYKPISTSTFETSSMSSLADLREEGSITIPKSQEAPERGYTEGPVQIYDSGVFLYLEPTADEASKFDTVINVAKEITSPFTSNNKESGTVMSVWRSGEGQNNISEPQTAVSEVSFKSAFEWPQAQTTTTPTTPKQSSLLQSDKPEYIHVKWDHNSEILPDLFPLCRIIDERVTAGKRVLIHCQLGVSRSASLIIAYGLYKGYQPDFHSMYMAVKERSRWVGPNMSLIYQLTDFRSKCADRQGAEYNRPANPAWFQSSANDETTPLLSSQPVNGASVASNATVAIQPAPAKRLIAPLKPNKALPPVPLFSATEGSSITPRLATSTTQSAKPMTPADSSANNSQQSHTVKRAASRPLPFRARNHIASQMAIPPHRPKAEPGMSLSQSSSVMDLAMRDVPESPSVISPRAAEFVASPFGIKGAGDLAVSKPRELPEDLPAGFGWLPKRESSHMRTPSVDPRSPHQHTESKQITRNIDKII